MLNLALACCLLQWQWVNFAPVELLKPLSFQWLDLRFQSTSHMLTFGTAKHFKHTCFIVWFATHLDTYKELPSCFIPIYTTGLQAKKISLAPAMSSKNTEDVVCPWRLRCLLLNCKICLGLCIQYLCFIYFESFILLYLFFKISLDQSLWTAYVVQK